MHANSKKTHCPKGHPFDDANTRVLRNPTTGGLRRRCGLCENEQVRRYAKAHRANVNATKRRYCVKHRERVYAGQDRRILRTYGLTPKAYSDMLNEQNGVCAICQQKCTSGRRLAVDHDHASGAVRGLLCGNCNNGIGRFKNSAASLLAAAQYLKPANRVMS